MLIKVMCSSEKSHCVQISRTDRSAIATKQMSELQNTMNAIFDSPDEESITRPDDPKMANLEKRMIQPQVLIQGSNKRPKGKKKKKIVNPKEVIGDPSYAGDELRVIPPQPTVPTFTTLLHLGAFITFRPSTDSHPKSPKETTGGHGQ